MLTVKTQLTSKYTLYMGRRYNFRRPLGLPHNRRRKIATVCGKQQAAGETLEALRGAGVEAGGIYPLQDSFTSFILDQRLDMILTR